MVNIEKMSRIFDPNFDPLDTLNRVVQVTVNQQRMIETLVDSHNTLNLKILELQKTVVKLQNEIVLLDSK